MRIEKFHRLGSRLLFGGHLVHQLYMQGCSYCVAGSLATTDTILEDMFWLGVYPAVTLGMLTFVVENFVKRWGGGGL